MSLANLRNEINFKSIAWTHKHMFIQLTDILKASHLTALSFPISYPLPRFTSTPVCYHIYRVSNYLRHGKNHLIDTAYNYVRCFQVQIVCFHVTGVITYLPWRLGTIQKAFGNSVTLHSFKRLEIHTSQRSTININWPKTNTE
jgi:hypothetical protein